MNNPQDNNQECCPEFKPERWDGKSWDWENKPFIKEKIHTFFHIPFPPSIGNKITKMFSKATDAQAVSEDKSETLILFTDPTPFRSEILLSVTKQVPDSDNVGLSGKFESRVFDGGYNAIPKFMKEMDSHLAEAGKLSKKYLVHYAYCPKCAKKYGHNYLVLFAQV